jgi:Ca2+/H+ antiporter, TMEM165/GDT1 family
MCNLRKEKMMNEMLMIISLVTIAEIGDKTQLLTLMLIALSHKKWNILTGITIATLLNHLLAAMVGVSIANQINPTYQTWITGIVCIFIGLWLCKKDEPPRAIKLKRLPPVLALSLLYFVAEMGDKTQIATVTFAFEQQNIALVTTATLIGMLLANAPICLIPARIIEKCHWQHIQILAAACFIGYGMLVLWKG